MAFTQLKMGCKSNYCVWYSHSSETWLVHRKCDKISKILSFTRFGHLTNGTIRFDWKASNSRWLFRVLKTCGNFFFTINQANWTIVNIFFFVSWNCLQSTNCSNIERFLSCAKLRGTINELSGWWKGTLVFEIIRVFLLKFEPTFLRVNLILKIFLEISGSFSDEKTQSTTSFES